MSSYTVLYRKYRPADFSEVKGQEAIVKTLKNQIKADRIGHAYLLCGTRGTGKTTIAKILAKAVNCEHPVDGNPCGVCKSCQSIADGTSMNVIEIDAASNNGVDNIRQIRDEVQYSPTDAKYRVYIIDEVHMLSVGAFNALLKTLEEPPSYVIFILATTEAHKLPITILSRCQRYDLKRITTDVLATRLTELMEEEQIEYEEKAIRYIAKAADGSLRDALSLLERCIAFYLGEKLTYEHVLEVLGAVDTKVYSELLCNILAQDTGKCMELIEDLIMSGRELGQFVTDFTWYLRNLLIIKSADNPEEMIEASFEKQSAWKEEAALIEIPELMRFIRIFSELSNQMKFSTSKRVLLEIAVIKLMQPEMEQNIEAVFGRLAKLERKLANGHFVNAKDDDDEPAKARENLSLAEAAQEKVLEKASPEDLKRLTDTWKKIIAKAAGIMKVHLKDCQITTAGDNRLVLNFTKDMAFRYMQKDSNRQMLEELITKQTGKIIAVECNLIQAGTQSEDRFMENCKNINMMIFEEEE